MKSKILNYRLSQSLVYGVAMVMALTAADPALALVTSSTDPATIITAALTFILGPVGIGLATLGMIVMVLQMHRFGLSGMVMYIAGVSVIFGSSYVVNQLLGGV